MKPENFFSKAAESVLLVLCLVISASQACAELKIDSVSQTVGVMGKNMEVTLTGSGFDENTKVSMYIDSGNRKAIIGSMKIPDAARNIFVNDDKAYVVFGGGLHIIDVSDPKNPKTIGSLDTPGYAESLTVVEDTAYIAGYEGIQVIDIRDKKKPKIIGAIKISAYSTVTVEASGYTPTTSAMDMPDNALSVAVNADKAYVTTGRNKLHIIDISDLKSTKIIGTIDIPGYALSITVVGNTAFITAYDKGLQIIDVSNPKNPQIIGSVDTPGSASGVTVIGNTAFVADKGLQVIDISNPKNPKIVGSVDTPGLARGISVVGNTAFVADNDKGLQIIDISNPKTPQIVGSIDTPGSAHSVTINEGMAFVADGSLQIIDIRDQKKIQIIGSKDTSGFTKSVIVKEDKAFIADGDEGLKIMDVSQVANPQLISSVDTPGSAHSVTINEGMAFVADGDSGLQIIDISNPQMPQIIGSVDTPGSARSVFLNGDRAFVADGDSGLQIIDISNPKNLQIIGSIDDNVSPTYNIYSLRGRFYTIQLWYMQTFYPSDYAYSIAVVGDTAFVADGYRLLVVDISDPKNPKKIGSVDTKGSAQSVTVIRDTAFVAAGDSGLQVVDISDPRNPKIIGSVDMPGFAKSVVVNGDKAFVADNDVQIIDISDTQNPKIIASLSTVGIAYSVAIAENKIYVADDIAGLTILPLPVEINSLVVKNDKQISFILPAPEISGDYSLRVYNNNGNIELPGAVEFVKPENAGILKSKAIIVAGSGKSADNKIWEETKKYTDLAYKALRYQGYTEDNILYLSSEYTEGVNMDALKKNLQYAIQQWAAKDNPPELLIYFAGHGIENQFTLNAFNEKITADELDTWLDNLQTTSSMRITFIYDACQSGSFIDRLKPPQGKERVIITSASANEAAYFTGENAFSYLFWSTIYGKTARRVDLYSAFNFAQERIGKSQTPLVEANGNDIHNESQDKEKLQTDIGRNYYDFNTKIPMITEAYAALQSETTGVISAAISGEGIDSVKVWAEITAPNQLPPSPDIPVTDVFKVGLTDNGNGKFSLSYDKFNVNGTYTIAVYAINTDNNIPSAPKYVAITQTQGKEFLPEDLYEQDDSPEQARYIAINSTGVQPHNFHKAADADWIKFNAVADQTYTVRVSNMSVFCDPSIALYDVDGKTLISEMKSAKVSGENKLLSWKFTKAGRYYVKIANLNPDVFGNTIRYDLELYQPSAGGFHGEFTGTITDESGKGIAGAGIRTSGGGSDVTDQYGHFTIVQQSGTFTVTPFAPGYVSVSYPNQVIKEDQTSSITLKLESGNCINPPTAKIASPSSTTIISKGESVNFRGNVTGGNAPYEYFWYFGGAPNSDKQNPGNVQFNKPDNPDDVNIFPVVFYVKDADGCVGKSQPVNIKVNYVAPQPESDSGGGGCFIQSVF